MKNRVKKSAPVKRVSIAKQNAIVRQAVQGITVTKKIAKATTPDPTPVPMVNPKTGAGALKAPLQFVPPSAEYFMAQAFAEGVEKYGPFNWRESKVPTLTYIAAAKRHLAAYFDGEDIDPTSDVPHLAHAMASLAIILDAGACGTLVDDRPSPGQSAQLMRAYHASQIKKTKIK